MKSRKKSIKKRCFSCNWLDFDFSSKSYVLNANPHFCYVDGCAFESKCPNQLYFDF